MSFTVLSSVIILLIMGFIFYRVFGNIYKQIKNRNRLAQEGTMAVAYVLGIAQTGVTVNQRPEMRIALEIENIGGQSRKVEIKQLVDLGSIPRAGDRVYVLIDPKNPDNVVLSPTPFGNGATTAIVDDAGRQTGTIDLGDNRLKDYIALTPELQQRGKPGVGTVVSVMPSGGRENQVTLDIDHIGQPAKRVTITQIIDGSAPTAGTRLYYLYDPQNPDHMALMPASFSNGQTLTSTNRLDPLVLGPQLLQEGAKATGTVLAVQSVALANPILADKGYSKWVLQLNVKPQSAAVEPYKATLTISLTSKEKADKIAHAGAEVPLRYDPLDLQTISIDSITMGYPDPYEATMKIFSDQLSGDKASK